MHNKARVNSQRIRDPERRKQMAEAVPRGRLLVLITANLRTSLYQMSRYTVADEDRCRLDRGRHAANESYAFKRLRPRTTDE